MSVLAEEALRLRRSFQNGNSLKLETRRDQLTKIIQMLNDRKDEICDAICRDSGKTRTEAYLYEFLYVVSEARAALKYLDAWTKPTYVERNLLQILDDAYIMKQPLGVVLIMAPSNSPIACLLGPLVGALAAGNCVVLKPSEHTVHTNGLLESMIRHYLDYNIVWMTNCSVEETTELLKEKFDHIFFTGSPKVGKIILKAAAEHLTPVTLELGGKCPVIVDQTCDVRVAARRVAWGKMIGVGQTCLAPDYVFVHQAVKDSFVSELQMAWAEFYGTNALESHDYGRMINKKHFNRVRGLIQMSSQVAFGGTVEAMSRYIAPTIVDGVDSLDDPLLKEEIFGPVLFVLPFQEVGLVIAGINLHEHPLAIYIFSNDQALINEVNESTHCGGVTINDVLLHGACDTLPFGGVGASGMGRYHGKFSFDCFTHEKSVLHRPIIGGERLLSMRYPPFTESKIRLYELMLLRRSFMIDVACILPFILLGFILTTLFKVLF